MGCRWNVVGVPTTDVHRGESQVEAEVRKLTIFTETRVSVRVCVSNLFFVHPPELGLNTGKPGSDGRFLDQARRGAVMPAQHLTLHHVKLVPSSVRQANVCVKF